MFKKKAKTVAEIKPELPASQGLRKKEKPMIHSMPKRFLNAAGGNARQAKNIGIIILIVGAFILIIGFALAFFYFTKIEPSTRSDNLNTNIADDNTDPEVSGTLDSSNYNDNSREVDSNMNSKDNIDRMNNQTAELDSLDSENIQEQESVIIKKATTSDSESDDIISESASTTPIIISKRSTTTKIANIKDAPDSDGDGLSDREEPLLNTSSQSNDSDDDGFSDMSELLDLYNPAGSGKIIVNSSIKKFSNPTYSYVLYYPSSWQVRKVGGDDSVIFETGNNQFVQIIGQTNPESMDLEDWYRETIGAYDISPGQRIYKKGWLGIRSENQLVNYLQHPGSPNILTVTYNLGIDETLYFQNIFQMMINSLELNN